MLARLVNDSELLFHEQAVSDNGHHAAVSQEFGECSQEMGE
jgi:hypothetical protein